jgi:oligopeptide transport system substrate-binding protein
MKFAPKLLIAGGSLAVIFAIGCATAEPTQTPVPPTATSMPQPTATSVPTEAPTTEKSVPSSSVAPTATAIAEATAQAQSDATAKAEAAEAMPEEVEKPEPEMVDARQGGVFRLLGTDPTTLDPALTADSTSYDIVMEIFSGLVRLNDDPNQPIVNDLAESFTLSEDGTLYKFKLRENAMFSNGTPVTAEDFKWSWERAAAPETGSTVVKEFLGDIVGINDVIDGNATSADGITVVDDHTLEVKIDAPKPYFIAKLTYPTTFVVSRNNIESGGENWTDAPVGTGPFVLKSYEIGVSMILARNENYWGDKALLDEVQFNLAGGSAMAMYENDEIDVSGIPFAAFERVTNPTDPISQEVVDVPPEFFTSYIGFNVEMPPFDDGHFRRALNYAIDKQLIAEAVLQARVTPADGPIPQGFIGFNPDLEPLGFDEEKAIEELKASKYANPETRPRIVFTVSGTGGSPPVWLQAVADMWDRTLGVKIEFQEVEWATFLQEIDNYRLQMFALAWSPDYPDPHTFVDVLFRSDSAINQTHYANDEVDALLDKATTEQDPVRRVQLYQQAEQIIVDEAPWVPMWWGAAGKILVKPNVNGFSISPLGGYFLRDVWLDKKIDF